MKENSAIRQSAWDALTGNWGQAVIATLAVIAIGAIGSVLAASLTVKYPAAGQAINFAYAFAVATPLFVCYTMQMRNYLKGDQTETAGKILNQMKENYQKTFSLGFFVGLYIFLWSLLLVIPGIIKAYSYAMTYYIAQDNPDMTTEECINKSMEIMNGNKMKLFLLDLSFIGWFFLGAITAGIGYLWVYPYYMSARAAFYEDLKSC